MKWWQLPVALCAIPALSGCGSTSSAVRVSAPVASAAAPSVDWSKVAISDDFKPMKSLPPAPAPAPIVPAGSVAVGFNEEGSAPVAVSSTPAPQRVATRLVTKQ
jgi:hypothetical protein